MHRIPFLTISGASGSGKTTLLEALIKAHPERFHAFQSVTTRPKRDSETGVLDTYVHVSDEEFTRMHKEDRFAWVKNVHDIWYGTTKESLKKALKDRRTSIFAIAPDIVGTLENLVGVENVLPIYILSLSPGVMRERLTKRGDTPEAIARRIQDCISWDTEARQSKIPFRFIENNGTIDDLRNQVLEILDKES